jgi:hypothetical protein
LAPDRSLITWLAPAADAKFSPRSVPDDAFRPLSDWVEYVLDHEHSALTAWIASTHFDFESFVCRDDDTSRHDKSRAKKQPARERENTASRRDENASGGESTKAAQAASKPTEEPSGESLAIEAPQPLPRSHAEQRLRELEAEFTALEAPPDAPERRALWREIARANAALERRRDATICWSNVFWEDRTLSPAELRAWLFDEERGAKGPKLSEGGLPALLGKADSRPIDAGALAAYTVWAAHLETPPLDLMFNQGAVASLLERQESSLPIRTAWLAWCAMARLSGGDVLGLAKARERA